jgi:type III secretion protein N (ATPase)
MIASGIILGARGGLLEAKLPAAAIGDGVRISSLDGDVTGTIGALRNGRAIVAAHDAIEGVSAGDVAYIDPAALTIPLGTMVLGRSFDARGVVLDGGPPLRGRARTIATIAPRPHERTAIDRPCWTGIRAIDALLTIGRGARIGIFGPPGAGKSTLLHTLVHGSDADAVVIGLIGERGREAEEWMRVAPQHAAIVCATSDRSAAERVRAARVAMAQADALRACGLHVLLILDSIARFAGALRELALANGDAVGRGGFPASVFSGLAAFVEIAGAVNRGSITLAATVLSDGDERDPVSDCARSLLDGHIQLSAGLAQAGRFPAIDVPASTSRTMHAVASAQHALDAGVVRGAINALAQTADARALGIAPANVLASRAVCAEDDIEAFLQQGKQPEPPQASLSALRGLADKLG